MYLQIIEELNRFLGYINIPNSPLNPNAFQSVLVKKLSNQNIIRDKRRINAGGTISNVRQTHLDITGRQGMLFFFEELNDTTTSFQSIDIDLFDNNLRYAREIDSAVQYIDGNNNIFFVRQTTMIPPYLLPQDRMLHSSAYKKYGHSGNQVQLNIPESTEFFTQLQKHAFLEDALVLLKYDLFRYLAILVPRELCNNLYAITNTHGNHNVNYVANNLEYNPTLAHQIQHAYTHMDAIHDDIATTTLQNILYNNLAAGIDIERVVKTRVSQGAFRRLLLLDHHQCRLCNITNTSVLRASHIKEWAVSSRQERVDSNNGLLLCANHDALFDRHLISFDPHTGNICVSASINDEDKEALNLSSAFTLTMSEEMKIYMEYHYNIFLNNENT